MLGPNTSIQRWPSLATILGCSVASAAAVAIDALFSAQEGYLSRPAFYDGAGYMFFARTLYELIRGLHLRTVYHLLINAITPGWNLVLALHYLIFGAGPWQAFTVRFWPVSLFFLLVYWTVRRRATRTLAIVAVVLTALLPMISAGVRSSSLEYLSGYSNWLENWYLDDLRPDLLAIALILWAVAVLAEHSDEPGRATFVVSALFAVAAVLIKPSTSPLLLLAWGGAVTFVWFINRRRPGVSRNALLGVTLLALLLAPWAVLGGIQNVTAYLYEGLVTYASVYNTSDNIFQRLWYFVSRIPTDLGPVEGWLVVAGAVLATIALARRRLGRAELLYASTAFVFYATFAVTTTRNTHVPEWTSMALWLYVLACLAHLAASWQWPSPRLVPALLGAVGLYALILYSFGVFALVNWPANERESNVQLLAVTADLAGELDRRITATDCFISSPGPGWPASIQFVLVKARRDAPGTLGLDPSLPPSFYVQAAKSCKAVITFREDISVVAQAFSALPAYHSYYRAVDQWVRSPDSGYTLDRSWSFTDLPPYDPHPLGRYQGLSLTVDLFVRSPTQS